MDFWSFLIYSFATNSFRIGERMHDMLQDLSVNSFFSIEGFAHPELFEGCLYAWEPLAKLVPYFQKLQLGQIEIEIPASVHLVNPELIRIGKGTRIEAGTYIEGPCVLGRD